MVIDDPVHAKDTASDVSDMISRGLTVQRFVQAEAVVAFSAHCENYPHEDWQKRHEAARLKRAAMLEGA